MIKMFVMDVDGTLTDGKIYVSAVGECFKAFNVKDGYGIRKLIENQIVPVIITGRESEIVSERCRELGIKEVYQGVYNKSEKLWEIMKKYDLKASEIAYIGDDENDLDCIGICGVTACPSDAMDSVKKRVNFITSRLGGDGAVREFIEWILGD